MASEASRKRRALRTLGQTGGRLLLAGAGTSLARRITGADVSKILDEAGFTMQMHPYVRDIIHAVRH